MGEISDKYKYKYFNLKYSVILDVLYFDSVYVIFLLHKAEFQQFCFLSGLKLECFFVEWEGEGLNALAVIKALLQDATFSLLDHKGCSGCVCDTVGVTLALLLHQLMRLSALKSECVQMSKFRGLSRLKARAQDMG